MSANVATAIYGSCDFFGGIAGMAFLHYFGRKTIMMAGYFCMAAALVIAGVAFNYEYIFTMYIALCSFIFSFAAFAGSAIWLIISECVQESALGLITMFFQLSAIEQSVSAEILYDPKTGLGVSGTLFFFATENFITLLFVIIFMKETKGKTETEKKMIYASVPGNEVSCLGCEGQKMKKVSPGENTSI